MTLSDQESFFRAFCGSFELTEPLHPEWITRFMGSNLVDVAGLLLLGEEVQCIVSDTLFTNPQAKQDLSIDYVPVDETEPLFGREPLGSRPVTHYFIPRPFVHRKINEEAGFVEGSFTIEAKLAWIMTTWSAIGFALRTMLRRKYGDKLIPVPFGVLSDLGVPGPMVWEMQALCIGVAKGDSLDKVQTLDYMDASSLGVLVQHRAIQSAVAISEGQAEKFDFQDIVKALSIGVPRTP